MVSYLCFPLSSALGDLRPLDDPANLVAREGERLDGILKMASSLPRRIDLRLAREHPVDVRRQLDHLVDGVLLAPDDAWQCLLLRSQRRSRKPIRM